MVSAAHFQGLSLLRARDMRGAVEKSMAKNSRAFENLEGRLTEISENSPSGALTFVTSIIKEKQSWGQRVLWVAGCSSIFYPLDFQQAGIALNSLPVVWAPGKIKALHALELVIRSGFFGLVIADLGTDWRLGAGPLGTMLKLAKLHKTALVFLTQKEAEEPSIGSMISLRAVITRTGRSPFSSVITITKDKMHAPGTSERTVYYGPRGMH